MLRLTPNIDGEDDAGDDAEMRRPDAETETRTAIGIE